MLVPDFQAIYGLDFRGGIDGRYPTRHALDLIGGLLADPRSRFRAAYLADHPPADANGAPSHLWWTPEAGLLATLGDLIIDALGSGKGDRIPRPGSGPKKFASMQDFTRALRGR